MLHTRTLRAWMCGVAVASAWCALTESLSAQMPEPRWRWTIVPYGWLPSIGGTLGIRDLTASSSQNVGDVLSKLKFAAMGVAEGGYGIWGAQLDAVYASLGEQKVQAIAGDTGSLILDQKLTLIQPTALWTVASGEWGGVDVLGGARFWNLDLTATGARGRQRSSSASFWDGIGGLRVRVLPREQWHGAVDGNIGAGGSKFTWEAQGHAAYDIATYWSLMAGYRYLKVKHEKGAARITGRISGVVVGVAYRQ